MGKIKEKDKYVRKESIIFFQSYEYFRRFHHKKNKLVMYSNDDFDLFFNEFLYQIDFKNYKSIYIEIDPIFCKLDEILEYIKESQNKKSNIYLISTNAQNFYEVRNRVSSENIMIELWTVEKIIDSKESSYSHSSLQRKEYEHQK